MRRGRPAARRSGTRPRAGTPLGDLRTGCSQEGVASGRPPRASAPSLGTSRAPRLASEDVGPGAEAVTDMASDVRLRIAGGPDGVAGERPGAGRR